MDYKELDDFLSTGIMNLDISSVGQNTTEFGEMVTVRPGLWSDSWPKLSKYTIHHYGEAKHLLFISIIKPNDEYEFLRVALYPNATTIYIKKRYNADQENRYILNDSISEKDYYSSDGWELHKIDYKLYRKMRHFRNFYDAYYFGEEE